MRPKGLPAPHPLRQRLWTEVLAGHAFRATIANRKKTGEIYHVEETITPITDETGKASHFVAVMQDITEALNRQEQQVQLRLARQIQQKFYRAAPTMAGFDVAAAAFPAYETSGDYFDFIPLPHNRLGIAVGGGRTWLWIGSGDGVDARLCPLLRFDGVGGRSNLEPGQSHVGGGLERRLLRDPHARVFGFGCPIPGLRRRGSHPRIPTELIRVDRTHF